jgi:CheY-like chemotaxis protein
MMQATLLVVDDDDLTRKLVSRMLNTYGYDVIDAGSGEDALILLAQNAVDMVLMDVLMTGIDGFEVCRRIKGSPATNKLPVVLFTAMADEESCARGIECGARAVIQKPPDLIKLQKLIAQVLVEKNA